MSNKIISGIIVLTIGFFLLILQIIKKIQNFIKVNKLKYKETVGVVIKSINTSDVKYKINKNEEYFNKHKGARSFYNFLMKVLPTSVITSDIDKGKGSVFASVIQYEVNNKRYEIVSDFSSDKKEKKNTKYKIKYNPDDPTESFIINDRGKIITFSLTIILLILGAWLLFS